MLRKYVNIFESVFYQTSLIEVTRERIDILVHYKALTKEKSFN